MTSVSDSAALRKGLTSLTAFAIVNQTSAVQNSKMVALDAEIYLESDQWPTLLGSLSYFNASNLTLTSPDPERGLLCLINVSVCLYHSRVHHL